MIFRMLVLTSLLSLSLPSNAWVDTDKDGVPDKKDACPDTPLGIVVLANGCSDTVALTSASGETNSEPDNNIENTNGGVSAVGLPMRVYFQFSESQLPLTQVASLAEFIPALNQSSFSLSRYIQLVGHTDSVGSEQFNDALSIKRAKAVKSILVNEYGINTDLIRISGKGSREPVTDNKTVESRQLNRRVELTVNINSK